MSLVNDMLKDLEDSESKRVESASPTPFIDRAAASDDLANDTGSRAQTWSKLSAFFVFFGILGGYYLWQYEPETQPDSMFSSSVNPPVDSVLLNAEVLAVLDETEPEKRSQRLENSSAGFQNDLVSAHVRRQNQVVELADVKDKPAAIANMEKHIRSLLDAGAAALKLDRLQTPKQDNAYDRFTAVLALQPDNLEAQQGLEKVQQRYLGFIKNVINKGQYYKVPDLVKKARDVGAEQADIDAMLNSMPVNSSRQAKSVIKHLEQAPQQGESQSLQTISESFSSRDQGVATQAESYYSEGRVQQGDALLNDFMSKHPQAVYALQTLFDSYLSQQRLEDAEAMIDQASHLPGDIFSYMVGQLLTRRGDLEGAMRALNLHQPNIENMPGYYALKAGLLHKMGEQSAAIVIYQQLIIIDNHNTSYWLGLAVCMDALQAEQALSVFEKVRQLSAADASYMAYVNQRIDALSKSETAGGAR